MKIGSLKNYDIYFRFSVLMSLLIALSAYGQRPPKIDLVFPKTDIYNTMKNICPIKLNITGISEKYDLEVYINDEDFTRFTYDQETGVVRMTPQLNTDSTKVDIVAENAKGKSLKTILILHKSSVNALTPKIEMLKPNQNEIIVRKNIYVVEAFVQMSSREDIMIQVNESLVESFDYDESSEKISFVADLLVNENYINISASNSAGSAQKMVKIIYKM